MRRSSPIAWMVLAFAVAASALVYIILAEHSQQQAKEQESAAMAAPRPKAPSAAPVPGEKPAHPATPKSELPPIRIGWTAWADAEVVTHLAKRVLEERMGYRVKLAMADIGIQYQGLATGDLDVMLMAWLPKTHREYWKKVCDKVVNLGPIYTRAHLGWVVPDYVPKDVLGSIEDLHKPAVRQRLGGRIQGIDPGSGLMQASEQAMKAYGLTGYRLVSASGAAMTAALGRAISRNQWIVVTGWSPHWMFARWKLRYLADPRRALGGRERVHALVRKGFYQDYPPEVTEFFTRMYIPLGQLEHAMLEASKTSVDAAVADYIAHHAKRIHYWVTGEM